jgi:peptidyl-tRNA hydrolase, PTH1 family
MKYLIAGLGNIGDEYAGTRHNIGFSVVDAMARVSGVSFQTGRYADVARLKIKNKTLVLIRPSTYMNLSGKAVRYWLEAEKIPIENLLVVVDDIALPPGQLRMRMKGGDGGHNGLSSIIEILGTEEFARLRFGIGNDFAKGYQTEYVLGKWTAAEEELLIPKVGEAVEMIKIFVLTGEGQRA